MAIERRFNPHLRSRPIVIGDTTLKGGIVVVCSAESRRAGIVESMPLARARKRCRDLVVVPARHDLYRDTARRIRDHLARFTPCVEAVSLDRVYLDLTGTHPLFGAATGVGARLSREIAARFGLVPAVGVAANKLVARVAADAAPPHGLCDVPPGQEAGFLAPLAVARLPGVEVETVRRLRDLGIETIGELAATDPQFLAAAFGRRGRVLHTHARGIDDSPVVPPSARPRTLAERTELPQNVNDADVVTAALHQQVEALGFRLRALGLVAARLSVSLVYIDGRRERRNAFAADPICLDRDLLHLADRLLQQALIRRVAVRDLGVRATGLSRASSQLGLFTGERRRDKDRKLAWAVDTIRRRFGGTAITRARLGSLPPMAATTAEMGMGN